MSKQKAQMSRLLMGYDKRQVADRVFIPEGKGRQRVYRVEKEQ